MLAPLCSKFKAVPKSAELFKNVLNSIKTTEDGEETNTLKTPPTKISKFYFFKKK